MHDEELYEELDRFSEKLRKSAGELLKVMSKIEYGNHAHKGFSGLSHSLKKLQTTPIEELDDVIVDINHHGQLAALETIKANTSILPEFVKKADAFVYELNCLTRKAIELSQQHH